MERIIIKDFGPITYSDIEIKTINLFIGATSSGKSTAAKLIAIFKGLYTEAELTFSVFTNHLKEYNIDFSFRPSTEIEYSCDNSYIRIGYDSVQKNNVPRQVYNPVYIPAERAFFATLSQSIFALISNNVPLPRVLVNFGAQLEKARRDLKEVKVSFLDAIYQYDGQNDFISLPDGQHLPFFKASSGLQSAIPLLLIAMYNIRPESEPHSKRDFLVIEEPELNLFPSTQKALLELIIARVNRSPDKLLITTHSPYLLTTLDNMMQAKTVAQMFPSRETQVSKLVSRSLWFSFENTTSYFFEKGTCRSTLDKEMKSIGPANIDDVSDDLSVTFEQLLNIKYPQA